MQKHSFSWEDDCHIPKGPLGYLRQGPTDAASQRQPVSTGPACTREGGSGQAKCAHPGPKQQKEEEAAGLFMAEGHSKDSLLSFLSHALGFGEIQSLRDYEAKKTVVVVAAAVSEDEQLVGFSTRATNTWRDIWDSRDDGSAPS
ncbi:hypothetical protein JOQ06_022225 [Pogonophryne albipinna]|uniref:Uncharacterized protein n=1 Tax=Pogonophryne albipinna TaxID=1090488 RepID=A0AAD6F289_9TELE|nr:hypothetical protein JOQ06_022225 [Pogonophryne albipinna]